VLLVSPRGVVAVRGIGRAPRHGPRSCLTATARGDDRRVQHSSTASASTAPGALTYFVLTLARPVPESIRRSSAARGDPARAGLGRRRRRAREPRLVPARLARTASRPPAAGVAGGALVVGRDRDRARRPAARGERVLAPCAWRGRCSCSPGISRCSRSSSRTAPRRATRSPRGRCGAVAFECVVGERHHGLGRNPAPAPRRHVRVVGQPLALAGTPREASAERSFHATIRSTAGSPTPIRAPSR